MPKHALRLLQRGFYSLIASTVVSGQELAFRSDSIGADTAAAISALATQTIPIYRDSNRDRFLDNLFRLQMVAGRYADAGRTLDSLRALRRDRISASATAADILYQVLATAKARSDDARFADTF